VAVVYNARGTSVPYFTIGKKGTTIFQGSSDPSGSYTIKDGDIWIDTTSNSLKVRNSSAWEIPGLGNLAISGNTLSSTDTNGNIQLSPDGSGVVLIGDGAAPVNNSGVDVMVVQSGMYLRGDGSENAYLGISATDNAYTSRFEISASTNVWNLARVAGEPLVELQVDGNEVWHAGNDGASSGLDADTVDSKHASDFVQITETQVITGQKTFESDLTVSKSSPLVIIEDDDSTGSSVTGSVSFRDSGSTERARIGYISASDSDFSIENDLGLIDFTSASAADVTSTANANAGSDIVISAGDGGNSVDGTAGDGGDLIFNIGDHGVASGTGSDGTEGDFIVKTGDGTTLLTLNSTGAVFNVDVSATDLINTSSRRYKKDIRDFSDTSNFSKIRPVFYRRKDTDKAEIGFIAEEMFEQYPELVHFNKEGEIDGIDYGKISAILTSKVQQQDAIIEHQTSEIEDLRSRLSLLEEIISEMTKKS
jgi:hypothetical protein